MTNETLYRAMGDIKETYIAEARTFKKAANRIWLRCGAIAAGVCLAIGIGILSNLFGNGGGPFGNGDATVYAIHREDFTPDIESTILAQFEDPSEVKKAYLLRSNEWFLSDELTDFSQVVTTDTVYVVHGSETSSDSNAAYSIYDVDAEGNIRWDCTAYPPANTTAPFGLSGLTYERIHHALSGIEHEDYIITYAPRLGTVFIWIRGTTEDTILAYPTRPDLLGLENGGMYSLHELQAALTNAYHSGNAAADHDYEDSWHSSGDHHADEHYSTGQTNTQMNDHHAQHSTAKRVVGSMGCNDRNCTDSSHFHDCTDDCDDPAHYHSCDPDCRIKSHNHPKDHHKDHH